MYVFIMFMYLFIYVCVFIYTCACVCISIFSSVNVCVFVCFIMYKKFGYGRFHFQYYMNTINSKTIFHFVATKPFLPRRKQIFLLTKDIPAPWKDFFHQYVENILVVRTYTRKEPKRTQTNTRQYNNTTRKFPSVKHGSLQMEETQE